MKHLNLLRVNSSIFWSTFVNWDLFWIIADYQGSFPLCLLSIFFSLHFSFDFVNLLLSTHEFFLMLKLKNKIKLEIEKCWYVLMFKFLHFSAIIWSWNQPTTVQPHIKLIAFSSKSSPTIHSFASINLLKLSTGSA